MYDPAMRTGRYGYEIQYRMLVRPDALVFDPAHKKLGEHLDHPQVQLESPVPYHWSIVADTCPGAADLRGAPEPPPEMRPWLLSDHHAKLRDSVGYNTLWMYRHERYIAYQLELVTRPLDDRYTERAYLRDARMLYQRSLAELLDRDLLRAWPGTGQQGLMEQTNIEIDDVRWPKRVDPLRKLSWLSAGVFLLTRLHRRLSGLEPSLSALLGYLDADLRANFRAPHRFDMLTNHRMLFEAWFRGASADLSLRRLQRMVRERALIAALIAHYDNDACTYYVHGTVPLTARELRALTPSDLALLRSLGIDALLIDVLTGRPQPHVVPDLARRRRAAFLREGLGWFCDLPPLSETVEACVFGGTPPVDTVDLPLFHLRKHHAPGSTYIEFRGIHGLKNLRTPRYRYQYLDIPSRHGAMQVVWIGHLHALTADLRRLLDVAIQVGCRFTRDILDGHPEIRSRDLEAVEARYLPMAAYLLDHLEPIPWRAPAA